VNRSAQRAADLVEIHELCSRYMAFSSQFVVDRCLEVFTKDAEYSAFGTVYPLERIPALPAAAPRAAVTIGRCERGVIGVKR
jgi:hypothetical protein